MVSMNKVVKMLFCHDNKVVIEMMFTKYFFSAILNKFKLQIKPLQARVLFTAN